jgi:hypothetical protein
MSKIITSNKFDNKSLGINREINEEIGQLKNNRIHYTTNQNLKNSKSREKQNIYQNQRINIRLEERNKHTPLNQKKSNTKISYNNYKDNQSLSKDKISKKSSSKSKEKIKLIKTKVIKKRNIGQVERVVIDLINEDIDSIKTEQSNNYSIYDSEKQFRHNKEYNINDSIQYKNKDNNGTNSTNSINEKLLAINKIEGRWLNNSISNNEVNLSFIYNEIQSQKMMIENMIKNWKKNIQIKKEVNINFIKDKNAFYYKNMKEKWNNDIKIIKGNNLTFLVDEVKLKEKEMNDMLLRWNNGLKNDNNIIISFKELQDKNIFKYSEEKYLKDVISSAQFPEIINNNNNIFYLLNISNNPNKLNYKVINPKDKNELESLVFSFYKENKLNSNIKGSNNSLEQLFQIHPLIILNEEQMNQLNEKINKSKIKDSVEYTGTDSKKENADTQFTISKQIAIDYEIIEQTQSNITKTDKLSDTRKVFQDFGQSTPLSMLYEKFLVFAVSRNIKYSVNSPQNNVFYINELNKIKKYGFDSEKLLVNKFSLWIEKIDKIESIPSTEKKQ